MLRNYLNFIINPKKYYHHIKGINVNHFGYFVKTIGVTYILLFAINLAFSLTNTPEIENSVASRLSKINDYELAILLLLIPIYEELLFRLILVPKLKNFYVFSSILVSTTITALIKYFLDSNSYVDSATFFYISSLILAIPIYHFSLKISKQRINIDFFSKNYNIIFYISNILFCTLHLFNYNKNPFSAILILQILISYLVQSYSLSFTRITLNFTWAIVLHFILISPILFKLILST